MMSCADVLFGRLDVETRSGPLDDERAAEREDPMDANTVNVITMIGVLILDVLVLIGMLTGRRFLP
jgi:hypothetical protein